MAIRPKAINGLYNIECACCSVTVKSNEIMLGAETKLPYCSSCFLIENHIQPIVIPPLQRVPKPSNKPADKFITYTSPDE
jgi:hypothetical protein